jgi:hypothetical protein
LAAEPRFRRRQLSEALRGALSRVEPRQRLGRIVYSGVEGESVFIFLVVPKREDETYDEYRRYRLACLHAYCRTAKLKAPLGKVFVGIGLDNPHKNYSGESEDLFVFSKDAWSSEELHELEEKRAELGILGEGMQVQSWSGDEFPPAIQVVSPAEARMKSTLPGKRLLTTKRRDKMRKESKRKNRR